MIKVNLFILLLIFVYLFSCQSQNETTTTTNEEKPKMIEAIKDLNVERGLNSLKLTWSKSNCDLVKIYYSTDPKKASKEDGTLLATITEENSYTHSNLEYEILYYYALYAVYGEEYAPPSKTNNITLNGSTKKINFFDDLLWGDVTININNGSSFQMTNMGDRWFYFESQKTDELIFNFKNSANYLPSQNKYFKSSTEEIWIKDGIIYTYKPDASKPTDELCILTLNLHTYQESDAQVKLDKIADVIARLKPDFVCFQECAQHKVADVTTDERAPFQDGIDKIKVGNSEKQTNMVYLISKRLKETHSLVYNYYWSWAHYGWDVWEEGVAVLTPYEIKECDNRYISTQKTTGSIDSRKALFVKVDVPNIGIVNIFSVHTSWGSPQQGQYDKLREFMQDKSDPKVVASIVAGDFNGKPSEYGYKRITSNIGGDRLMDAYYIANNSGLDDTTMLGDKHNGISRIDFVFYNYKDRIVPKTGQVYFMHLDNSSNYLGEEVSDHNGVIVRLKVLK